MVANALIVASGVRPSCAARCAVITSTAAAPSLMPDAFAAVTEPSFANAGLSPDTRIERRARLDEFVGVERDRDRPCAAGIMTGVISSLNTPAFCAFSALFWLATANSSCCARAMPYCFATFSAVVPMWYWL